MNTTSTAALAAAGATGTLTITNPDIINGAVSQFLNPSSLSVYNATPDGTKTGAFLVATPDFVGSWTLCRHTSGLQAGGPPGQSNPLQQVVARGDHLLLQIGGAGPLITMTSFDALTLIVTARSSGSIMLTVVQ